MDNSISDEELINAYLAGDDRAFGCLYEKYRRILYSYIRGLLTAYPSDADDVYQQSWIKAIDHLKSFRTEGSFGAWLLRIARNLVIDRARRRKVRMSELSLDREDVPELPEAGSEPWRMMDAEDLGSILESALRELPEEQKEVFVLRKENVPFKEIAELQNCSLNTALGRMQYACRNLRKYILKNFARGAE